MVDAILAFTREVMNLGAGVLMPVIIAILGLIFRMKPGHAIKAGLLVGIGFQGLGLVVSFMISSLQPVLNFYKSMGSGYDTIEIGFAALGAASWTVPFAVFAVPSIIILNIVMLRLKWTHVMNVDIWNFMHFLVPGALAFALTGNAVFGFLVTVGLSVITLFIAEKAAPEWQEQFGLDGTTCSTLSLVGWEWPIAWGLNKLIDVIPGLNKINLDLDTVSEKLGVFGDPAFIGVIAGIFLSVMTRQNIPTALTICMAMAAVMVLIPRMVGIMMEGITPIGNAANSYMKTKIGDGQDVIIGMDVAMGLGDPACITCTAIMIPITIGLSFLVPNMRFFPLGMLAEVCYISVMPVMATKGNIFRTLVIMSIFVYFSMWFMSMNADYATAMLNITKVTFEGTSVTATHFGWNPGCLLVTVIARLMGIAA